MPNTQPMVELRRINQRYFSDEGEVEAISELSLDVERGEFVSIVGQSGCGKSTLLSLIAGLMTPTSGSVLVGGNRVSGPSRRSGYMLQHDTLFEWRTILDNVMLGPEVHGLDKAKARERARSLLMRYGLGDFMDRFPQQLSGGMRQRAALARTLCTEPEILLLDEPFSALDSQTRLAIADEIGTILRQEGCTVILVTHDIAEAIALADRVVVLSARPGEIKSQHQIRFPSAGAQRPTPLKCRDYPEFTEYFNTIWRELEVHVDQ